VALLPTIQAARVAYARDAENASLRRVPLLALVINAPIPRRPLDLLEPLINVSVQLHPYVEAHLERHARRLRSGAWSAPLRAHADLLSVLRSSDVTTNIDAGAPLFMENTSRTIRLVLRGVSSRMMHLDDADGAVSTSELPVFDASNGAYQQWSNLRVRTLVARPQPSSPNLARLVDGGHNERVLSCDDALSKLDSEFERSIACEPFVAEMAMLTRTASVSDDVLLPDQRLAVGRYLGSKRGLLCALPPGAGKTVVAARALHHSAERALIVVPAGVMSQWERELAKFHPTADTLVVRSEAEIGSLQVHLTKPTSVGLVSQRLASKLPALDVDALVIDEAAYLRSSSRQTQALREQRLHAQRLLLLTGTPGERSTEDIGPLVAMVLGDTRTFAGAPLREDWRDRVGPLVFETSSAALPSARRELIVCELSAPEQALLAAASAELLRARSELASSTASAREVLRLRAHAHTAFERARVASTDAAGLTGVTPPSIEQLAGAVTTPAKRSKLVELCSDGVPTVVCCDSSSVVSALVRHLEAVGVRSAALTGEMNQRAREAAVTGLGATHDVLVVTKAGQLGWNIQHASRLVHYDVPLTAQAARQREGRVRRIGGSETHVVCLVLRGAVDFDAALSWARTAPDSTGV
jgi:superfamily II DNA or RNA helicase